MHMVSCKLSVSTYNNKDMNMYNVQDFTRLRLSRNFHDTRPDGYELPVVLYLVTFSYIHAKSIPPQARS